MRAFAVGLLALVPAVFAGCAHGPSPEARRAAFFSCPGVTVDAAAKNLERAGLAVEAREAGAPVKTGWIEAEVKQDGVTQDLSFVIEAVTTADGVDFALVLANPEGETRWDQVTAGEVASDPYRTLLNKVRQNVCGTTDNYFQSPE